MQTESLSVLLCGHNLDCSLMFLEESLMSPQGNVPSPHAVAQAPLYYILNDVSPHIMKTRGDEPNLHLWPDLNIDYTASPDNVIDSGEWFSSDDKPFKTQPFYTSTHRMGPRQAFFVNTPCDSIRLSDANTLLSIPQSVQAIALSQIAGIKVQKPWIYLWIYVYLGTILKHPGHSRETGRI